MQLFTGAYWRAIAWALARTALAAITPFIPALAADPRGTLVRAGSVVGVAVVLTVATNLRVLDDTGTGPWWAVLLLKGVRQFGQMVAAGLATAVLLSDVDWHALLTAAATSAVSTIVLNALTLLPGDLQPAPVVNGVAQITTLPEQHRETLTSLREALADGAADSGNLDPAVAALDHVLTTS